MRGAKFRWTADRWPLVPTRPPTIWARPLYPPHVDDELGNSAGACQVVILSVGSYCQYSVMASSPAHALRQNFVDSCLMFSNNPFRNQQTAVKCRFHATFSTSRNIKIHNLSNEILLVNKTEIRLELLGIGQDF